MVRCGHAAAGRSVAVGQDQVQDQTDKGDDDRGQYCVPEELVDVEGQRRRLGDPLGDLQNEGVDQKGEQSLGQDVERKRQQPDDRLDDRIDQAEDQADDQEREDVLDCPGLPLLRADPNAWNNQRRQPDGNRIDRHLDQESAHAAHRGRTNAQVPQALLTFFRETLPAEGYELVSEGGNDSGILINPDGGLQEFTGNGIAVSIIADDNSIVTLTQP